MRLLSEMIRQLNLATLSLFGCALLAGPFLAAVLDNSVYYWDMLYCLSFMLAALVYTAGQRVSAHEKRQNDQGVSPIISVKWVGYLIAFGIVLAASVLFSKPQSTIATKLTYLGLGVVVPVTLFWSFRWLRKKVNGSEV
ncbi:hypothetical protein [Maritalea porphyrae]|uniref:hypothetical protein n=1 Tax=Maritalea porphyrae TaxID=880732 RepID=UPI0022B01D32|nr:hypothetical protein [Maritalea porphyrae]MCZ4273794.1 hypothetical protein [Maritalea porphyrae]